MRSLIRCMEIIFPGLARAAEAFVIALAVAIGIGMGLFVMAVVLGR